VASVRSQEKPIFYLTTAGEYQLLSKPRACWFIRRMWDANRDDYMLVRIEPPLIGQSFGLGGEDITELLLSTRHEGSSLYPVTEWPTYVYVARLAEPTVRDAARFDRGQVQLIAWGMLFGSLQDAQARAHELEKELL